ncbi:MAG: homoisocitrate dehydrogenase [Herpetosiphonaceae bacterium]|nr:MAG: homoisocitrate dehydrogenase [Herpetosiphonaceae bacterium]
MSYTICLIPGDGIGCEVIAAAREVLEAINLPARFVEAEAGWSTFERHGVALPDETLAAAQQADATLLGAVGSPSRRVTGYSSPVVALRKALDLYACVRPVSTPPLPGARQGIDLVVIRENTEGFYSGCEASDGVRATALRVVTRAASERIARFALSYARRHNRRRITIVHKANILRESCGLFRSTALEVLAEAAPILVDELLVDTAAYELVRAPERLDIVLTTNLFGDILSDAASAWGGGLGLAASANIGPATAIFEPVHGSAPDIAGRGIANPLAAITAAAMLLDYLGEVERGDRVRAAIAKLLRSGPHTPDLGGSATTAEVTQAIVRYVSRDI